MTCNISEATEGVGGGGSAHSPTIPSLHLRHSSFHSLSNPSVASSTSEVIIQPFRRFTYVTACSPTFCCFTYVTVHSPILFRFSYVTSSSLTSPGEPLMLMNYSQDTIISLISCSWDHIFKVRTVPRIILLLLPSKANL